MTVVKEAIGRHADHGVDDLFLNRWSPRAFTDQAIGEEDIAELLEAARWAPSARNVQPWRFAYALRGEGAWPAVLASLMPLNQTWAGKAAALIIVASATHTTNHEGALVANPSHAFDAGAAWVSLALHAEARGWAAHAMGGIDPEAARLAAGLPEGHVVHAIVALGKRGDAASLPDGLREREIPSGRRPLSELFVRI